MLTALKEFFLCVIHTVFGLIGMFIFMALLIPGGIFLMVAILLRMLLMLPGISYSCLITQKCEVFGEKIYRFSIKVLEKLYGPIGAIWTDRTDRE